LAGIKIILRLLRQRLLFSLTTTFLAIQFSYSQPAENDTKITAYFSFVHPILTINNDETIYNFQQRYVVGFPFGVNFIESEKIAFSFEFVPGITAQNGKSEMSGLLIHPGVIYRDIWGFNFLTRLAFNTNGRYGFTLVANHALVKTDTKTYFIAMPIPFRFGNEQSASVTVGLQFGIAF